MPDQFSRTRMQFGNTCMERLFQSKVAIFGIGGVGGYCVEALARTGIGHIDLFDSDRICLTNLNRQLVATQKTIGKYKVDVMRERILEIDPKIQVNAFRLFFEPGTAEKIDFEKYNYVVDAVDTVTAKLELICRTQQAKTRIISAMGAGNKINPAAFEVADIYDTSVCPLARIMRKELRKRKIPALKVVYSREPTITPIADMSDNCEENHSYSQENDIVRPEHRQTPSSNAFVPAVAGFILAGEVIQDLAGLTVRQN